MIKRDYKTDIENLMYKNSDEISSLIPYLYEGVHYALDLNAEPLLRAYMVSAIIAYLERENDDVVFEDILASRNLSDLSDSQSRSQVEIVRYVIVEEAYTTSRIMNNYNNWNFHNEKKILQDNFLHYQWVDYIHPLRQLFHYLIVVFLLK